MSFQMRAVYEEHIIWEEANEVLVHALIRNKLIRSGCSFQGIAKLGDEVLAKLKQDPDRTYKLGTGKEIRWHHED